MDYASTLLLGELDFDGFFDFIFCESTRSICTQEKTTNTTEKLDNIFLETLLKTNIKRHNAGRISQ
jgi:hypothetical protein